MTYTLVLIKDEGSFDKWGASQVQTVKKAIFPDKYSKLRLFQIAEQMMQEENIQAGEGYVHLYLNGELENHTFAGSL
jgi:hypothetical protein